MQSRKVGGRALVVGSAGTMLKAVDRDVRAMAEMLCQRGFTVDVRTGDQATRCGILEGYDALIRDVQPDEPAAFYYTGHGFHNPVENEPLQFCQGICPTDLHASTASDFRGITSWELSIKQAELTARTRNVTVILDCCFAAQMSREAAVHNAVPRVLPHPLGQGGFAGHIQALRERYPVASGEVDVLGNRDAVRLVACRQDGVAFEYQADDGEHRGAFTDALLTVLSEVGEASVSWAAIDNAICARVQHRFIAQRPMIEGPARRMLFSLDLDDDIGDAARILKLGDDFQLQAGRLMDVSRDDVYAAMPSGDLTYCAAKAIAKLRVRELSATTAELELVGWCNGHQALPPSVLAIPIEKHAPRCAVAVDVPGEERAAVEARIAATRTLRVAAEGEASALGTVRRIDGALAIVDPAGPRYPAMADLQHVVDKLVDLAAALRLRGLEGEHGVRASDVEIEFGTVEGGQKHRMPDHGGAAALRDRLYVRVAAATGGPLFAHVFNIGLRGSIVSLTGRSAPAGVQLANSGAEFVLGRGLDGSLVGCNLSWPDEILRDGIPRTDEIIVIVTVGPANLGGLETVARGRAARGPGSQLEELLAQFQDGVPRGAREGQMDEGFLVKRLSYLLHPRDAVMADVGFAIDDNPLGQRALQVPDAWRPDRPWRTPRGAMEVPTSSDAISIEISDFIIERRGALPTDIRIDALVCTRGPGRLRYAAWTQRCCGIVDGARLQLADPIVVRWAVRDFVDVHLWVSSDAGGTLEQLLADRAAGADLDDAGGPLASPEGAAGASWAVAGAAAVLARRAGDALLDAAGTSMGLWRTCFLAQERFGAGRQSAAGAHRTASFSFSLLVNDFRVDEVRQ